MASSLSSALLFFLSIEPTSVHPHFQKCILSSTGQGEADGGLIVSSATVILYYLDVLVISLATNILIMVFSVHMGRKLSAFGLLLETLIQSETCAQQ